MEEISLKDFQNLIDQVRKIENQINGLKTLPKSIQNLTERIEKIENKLAPMKTIPKNIQEVIEKANKIESDVNNINKETYYNREQIEEKIKVQEEIIMDMIKKFNDEFFKHKSEVTDKLGTLKTQQDVLKISYAINENKLIDKIKLLVSNELKNRIYGQESEILMKIWLDEFKEIANDFEKFKKIKPKEFNLRLNEILTTIEQFKEKIHTLE